MRFPKQVVIAGKVWKITYTKSFLGGRFKDIPPTLFIGTKEADRQEVFQILLHEIIEAVLTCRNHRYTSNNEDSPVFYFNHRDLVSIVHEISFAIRGMIR